MYAFVIETTSVINSEAIVKFNYNIHNNKMYSSRAFKISAGKTNTIQIADT